MFAIVSVTWPAAAGLDVLLAVSLKATVILAAATLVAWALGRASAAARHLVWTAALLGVMTLPLLALWGPTWSVRGLALPTFEGQSSSVAQVAEPRATPLPSSAKTVAKALEPLPGTNPVPVADPDAPSAKPPGSVDPEILADTSREVVANASANPIPWQAWAMALWALGVAASLGWLALGAWVLHRVSRRATPVIDSQWVALVERCARELGVRDPVALSISDRVAVPCAWGLWRPQVLIPHVAETWSVERRRAVLLHELGHVARRDCLVQTLAQIACALLWFHPLVWVAAWRLRIEREIACDDLVLGAETPATDYADHLLAVVRSLRGRHLPAMGEVAFARRSQLEGRLLAVLDADRPRGALTASRAVTAAVIAALLVLPLAALRPWSEPANAGTFTTHGKTQPEDAAASEVVRAPESAQSLTAGLRWAMAQADGGAGYWIGYEIARADETDGKLSDSGPIDIPTLDERWQGARVADVLAGKSRRDARVKPDKNVMVLTFHFAPGASRPDEMDRIRVQSQDLVADFGGEPLYWLGQVDNGESLEWARKIEREMTDAELRSVMLHAIGTHADEAVVRGHMVGVLKSKAPYEVRVSATDELARFTDPATVDLLLATLHDDRSEEVRHAAVGALGRMRSSASTRALSKLARDPRESEEVRRMAVEALGEKASEEAVQTLDALVAGPDQPAPASEPDPMLASDEPDTRITPRPGGQDIEVLDASGKPEVTIQQRHGKQKIKVYEQAQVDQEEIQRQAVQSLAQLPEETSLPKLIRIARTHSNTRVRREAIEAMARFESQRASEAILEFAWQEKNEELARAAVDALNGHTDAVGTLIEIARRHPLTRVRRNAIQALGHHETSREVVNALDKLVAEDPEEEVQREAVQAIGQLPEDVSLPRLEKIARSHGKVRVRREAIDVLGQFDPDKVVPILEGLIEKGRDSR